MKQPDYWIRQKERFEARCRVKFAASRALIQKRIRDAERKERAEKFLSSHPKRKK